MNALVLDTVKEMFSPIIENENNIDVSDIEFSIDENLLTCLVNDQPFTALISKSVEFDDFDKAYMDVTVDNLYVVLEFGNSAFAPLEIKDSEQVEIIKRKISEAASEIFTTQRIRDAQADYEDSRIDD